MWHQLIGQLGPVEVYRNPLPGVLADSHGYRFTVVALPVVAGLWPERGDGPTPAIARVNAAAKLQATAARAS